MKRLFMLVIGSNFSDKGGLHSFFDTNSTIPDWWHFLDSCYIFPSDLTMHQLQQQIVAKFPGQFFIIQEIYPKRYDGWLPKGAWDWLERYKNWEIVP